MPRHIRNPKIESRTARAELPPSAKPVYFDLGGKLHLGWRRGKGAGVWVARRYLGDEKYVTETIGEADDLADANGDTVLNFEQAQKLARKWSSDLDEKDRVAALGPVITVRGAVKEYMDERPTALDARGKLRHVLASALAEKPLAELKIDDLKNWRASVFKNGLTEAGVRRVANDVRAALNAAAERHGKKLPADIGDTIRKGLAVVKGSVDNTREKQILTDADIRSVVDAAKEVDRDQGWGGDLYLMILVLAATGARFGQVARLRVADLQVEQARLMMPSSRKGWSANKASHFPVPLRDDVLDVLKRAAVGRKGHEPLLPRPHWRRARGGAFGAREIYARGEWGAASTLKEHWKRVIAKAGLPDKIIAYSLRHSSIVRSLRAGLPIQLVGKLHDTGAVMIERFYGRFITDALGDLARAALIPMVTAPVKTLRAVEG